MAISHDYWHLVVQSGNFTLILTCSGQEWQFLVFRVNLGMWPLKSIISDNQALFRGFQHTFMGYQGHRWENVHFSTKPRHVTPQSNHLGKTSTVQRVSTHIYGVSQKIDGKTFIFRVNLGMWPLKSIVSEKQPLFWGFQYTCMGFLRR